MAYAGRQTKILVIQPTPFCNINCSYCYLPNRTSTRRISGPLAEKIFANVLSFPTIRNRLTVVWHAGEPMVLPPAYYEELFCLIAGLARPKLKVTHAIQTNGTLISNEWCALIKKWDIKVGVSIDGPQEIHDRHRVYRNGAGSFGRAFSGLQLLQSQGIPFHVIMVITRHSVGDPERIFDFLASSGITDVCFSIEEQEGANGRSELLEHAEFATLYRAFLERFYHLAIASRSKMRVRELDGALMAIRRRGRPAHNTQVLPFAIISIDCDGNLSTFSPELLSMKHARYGDFIYGNVARDEFPLIARRVQESLLYSDIKAGVASCARECDYFGLCGGGAPSNKIYENGTANSTETGYCKSTRIGLDVALDLLGAVQAPRAVARKV